MEQVTAFLATDQGKIFAVALIIIGVSDLILAKLVLGKQISKTEQQMLPTLSPTELQPLAMRIKSLQYAARAVITAGIIFMLFGIYGVTR